MTRSTIRAGVDIGGTFTDIALEVGGEIHSTKTLTTPERPEEAILAGLRQAAGLADIALADIGVIIHGTTLATNALIERSGAKTALITTQGFRDVIEMRTENRFEQYDLNITLPPPLIERRHRLTVCERVNAAGEVLIDLDRGEVEALADTIARQAYESIAVGLIHSYANGVHERMVRDVFRERAPDIPVSISCEVSPQVREFERFNTVCANAYVKPLMGSYLGRLIERLKAEGATCPVYVIHSGGGIIDVETAVQFPVRLIESGPAGGAIFATHIAARYGFDKVLSYDMGGTTAKICLIDDMRPRTAKTFEVARTYRFKKGSGMPISIPVIDMVEIGAGGGSIASVDAMRQIRVGPESAGSEPGPACYGRGGGRPTVSDADLVLGRLDPNNFAGGSITLAPAAAAGAMQRDLGEALGMDAAQAAYGLCEVVDENMANAARVHAVESGKDIGVYKMIAFGGAAPIHAARLCQKLGIDEFLVPPGAGVGSAIGFLLAPFSFEAVRTDHMAMSRFDAPRINRIIEELTAEADGFVRQTMESGELERECQVFMRYRGQGWEIPVDIEKTGFVPEDATALVELFEETYTRFFGRPIEGLEIEMVSWAVKVSSPTPPVDEIAHIERGTDAAQAGERHLFDVATERWADARTYERGGLTPGHGLTGPAVIVEAETATVVPEGFEAIAQSDGCLRVRRTPG